MDQNLINYIKQNKQKGFSDDQIRKALLDTGWEQGDIDEGFKSISEPFVSKPAPVQPAPSINKLPGSIALLKDAWGIYKSRFWVFIGIALIPILLVVLAIIMGVFGGMGFLLMSSFSEFALAKIILLVLLAILLAFIVSLIQIWGQVSLIYAIKDSEEKIGIIKAYKKAGYKLFSFLWVSILVGFITLGGFMLLAIPGIIFSIWFSLAIYILVAENLKGMTALLKSKEYIKGNWWKVLWRFIFIGLIVLIVSLVIEVILYFIKIPDLGKSIVNSLISLLFAPLVIAYTFLIYKNLKALKGEFTFTPTKKKKVSFIIIAIIGLLLIPGLILGIILVTLNQARDRAEEAMQKALEFEQQYQQETKTLLTIQGIKMTIPDKWSINRRIENVENITGYTRIYIKTDYRPYNVFLVLDIPLKNSPHSIETFKERRAGGSYTKINDGEIFKSVCGGALACNGAIVNDDVYAFSWDIEGDQPVLKDLNGVWRPDHNVTQEDIWNILLSIEVE